MRLVQNYEYSIQRETPCPFGRKKAVVGEALLGEYDGPDESVPERVVGLADAEGEEAVVAPDPPRADSHRVPAHLVQHHPDPVDLCQQR